MGKNYFMGQKAIAFVVYEKAINKAKLSYDIPCPRE